MDDMMLPFKGILEKPRYLYFLILKNEYITLYFLIFQKFSRNF